MEWYNVSEFVCEQVWFYIALYLFIFQGNCYSDVMYGDVPD